MKTNKIYLSIISIALATLLIGCGSDSDDSSTKSSNDNPTQQETPTQNNNNTNTNANNNTTNTTTTFQTINAKDIAGHTVFIKRSPNIPDEKELIYIFQKDKVKLITVKPDNSRITYDNGTYKIKNTFMGKEISIAFKFDEAGGSLYSIYLDDKGNIKEYQLPTDDYNQETANSFDRVIKIVPNDKNGINENTSTTTSSSNQKEIIVKSANDLKGYKIISNETSGSYDIHQQVTYTFNCDGSYDYILKTWGKNTEADTEKEHGKEMRIERGQFVLFEDSSADKINITGDNKLIEGHCLYSTNLDGSCQGDFKIDKINYKKCK
jgi:hypothetical protein